MGNLVKPSRLVLDLAKFSGTKEKLEDAIVECVSVERGLLAAPAGSGGEVFVHAGLEVDSVALNELTGLPERPVEPA